MKIKGTILLGVLLTSVMTGCAANEQNEPEDVNYQPTRYDQGDLNNRMEREVDDQRNRMERDADDPIIDRDEQEPDLGEEPSEERNNNNNDREMVE